MAFIMRDDNVFPEDFKKIWHEAHEQTMKRSPYGFSQWWNRS